MTLPRLLTIDEVADRLRVHRSTVFRLIRDGELESYRVADRRLVSEHDLATYLERCKTGLSNVVPLRRDHAPHSQAG